MAQAAARAGFAPVVVDLFADRETRAAATACHQVRADTAGHSVAGASLMDIVGEVSPALPLVYGGGLEAQPDLLTHLAQGRKVWGNAAAIVKKTRNPRLFFAALKRLGLSAPPVRWTPPTDHRGWLCKTSGSQGGLGITPCPQTNKDPPGGSSQPAVSCRGRTYYQKRLGGIPVSVQFIASATRFEALCFCRNHVAPTPGYPYRFGGLSLLQGLDKPMQRRLTTVARRLAAYFSLRGLGSLDVLLKDDHVTILEINPRPGAALDLLEHSAPGWSVPAHIAACRDRDWPPWPGTHGKDISLTVLYAAHDMTLPATLTWPPWCRDTPQGTAVISRGQPLCTIHSVATAYHSAHELSLRHSKTLRQILARYNGAPASGPNVKDIGT